MTFAQFVGNGSTGLIGTINTVVVPIIFALAFLAFVWGIIDHFFLRPNYYGSYGERGGYGQGRQFIFWGILGLAVLFSVWGFVNFMLSVLGIAQ